MVHKKEQYYIRLTIYVLLAVGIIGMFFHVVSSGLLSGYLIAIAYIIALAQSKAWFCELTEDEFKNMKSVFDEAEIE